MFCFFKTHIVYYLFKSSRVWARFSKPAGPGRPAQPCCSRRGASRARRDRKTTPDLFKLFLVFNQIFSSFITIIYLLLVFICCSTAPGTGPISPNRPVRAGPPSRAALAGALREKVLKFQTLSSWIDRTGAADFFPMATRDEATRKSRVRCSPESDVCTG